ncbi:MAG TPA: hypothetical protein VFV37_07255 [Luteibaculaceae bacterium]|nr:hypothetical protein [Luteibaculaceae bacterium]
MGRLTGSSALTGLKLAKINRTDRLYPIRHAIENQLFSVLWEKWGNDLVLHHLVAAPWMQRT